MKIWISFGAVAVIGAIGLFFLRASRFGTEKIRYWVREKSGRFELRDYPALPVARTLMYGGPNDESFEKLFRFIAGGNAREEKIAMTTPVLIDGPIGAQTSMSFGMPAETQRRGIPQSKAGAIEISERPRARVAVVRFSGASREAAEQKAVEELRTWMKTRRIEAEGDPIIAYYDAPFIPSPLRRNEAMLRVRREAGSDF